MKWSVEVTRDEDGFYVASCPALPGCHTQGDSLEEALENVREAIELCVEVRQERARKGAAGQLYEVIV